MKAFVTYIAATLFLMLFLAKGLTSAPFSFSDDPGWSFAIEHDQDEKENENKFAEKEPFLLHTSPDYASATRKCRSSKTVDGHQAWWTTVVLPVTTPPPEIA